MAKKSVEFVSTVKMDRYHWGKITPSQRRKLKHMGVAGEVPYNDDMKHKWNPLYDYRKALGLKD